MTTSNAQTGYDSGTRPSAIVVDKGTVHDMMSEADRAAAARGKSEPERAYWEAVRAGHASHRATLSRVIETLAKRDWRVQLVPRDEYEGPDGHDLVMCVGGDGTVLHASHKTLDVPLLGINSDPSRSVGYFSGTNADGVDAALALFENDELERFMLHRLRLTLDGEELAPPVLNDVLVANDNPAATSRYILMTGARHETQKSSGLWISTAAGSTAGIRSAGGAVLPLEGPWLQYLVREPVVSPLASYEMLRGVRALDEGLVVVSQMDNGYAYIDGPHVKVPLPLGARLEISAHRPLTLLGLEPSRRER